MRGDHLILLASVLSSEISDSPPGSPGTTRTHTGCTDFQLQELQILLEAGARYSSKRVDVGAISAVTAQPLPSGLQL